mmetsp:Transcript_60266/g.120911  ORF Transcript_60266/g.120911 Transcript_60266/m.120911 type:complete len:321 (-) Transcript_60266:279-1241(-)
MLYSPVNFTWRLGTLMRKLACLSRMARIHTHRLVARLGRLSTLSDNRIKKGSTRVGGSRSTVASTTCGSLTARQSSRSWSSELCNACSNKVANDSVVGTVCLCFPLDSDDDAASAEDSASRRCAIVAASPAAAAPPASSAAAFLRLLSDPPEATSASNSRLARPTSEGPSTWCSALPPLWSAAAAKVPGPTAASWPSPPRVSATTTLPPLDAYDTTSTTCASRLPCATHTCVAGRVSWKVTPRALRPASAETLRVCSVTSASSPASSSKRKNATRPLSQHAARDTVCAFSFDAEEELKDRAVGECAKERVRTSDPSPAQS